MFGQRIKWLVFMLSDMLKLYIQTYTALSKLKSPNLLQSPSVELRESGEPVVLHHHVRRLFELLPRVLGGMCTVTSTQDRGRWGGPAPAPPAGRPGNYCQDCNAAW